MGGDRDDWQSKAWDMLDLVGELRYYVGWRSSSCSRVRLVASDIDQVTGRPTGSTENVRAQQIAKSIANGPLGQAQLIKRAVECLTVPGEVWIAVLVTDDGEKWIALTREEIKNQGKITEIEMPVGTHTFNPAVDSMFRVWNPRPRRARHADSPVRATLDPLAEIVRTTQTISNASKSRLIGNGVVFVPNEMSLPANQGPAPAPAAGVPAAPIAATSTSIERLQELLFQVAMTAYDDQDSMAALIPMFAGGPGEHIKNITHLKFDNSVTEIAIKTRNDAIARLAMGLDVTPERLLGLGNNSNHWSAWQIGDDDVRLHIAPPIETLCDALTREMYRPVLEREGLDPDAFVLWYDTSDLTADPDLTDEAEAAFDRGAINAEAYRSYLGLDDNGAYDLTKLEGWQNWARDRVAQKPELLQTLLPLLTGIEGIDIAPPAPAVEPPPDDEQPEIESDDSTEGGPPDTEGDEPDSQTASIVSNAIVDVLVPRALELAGKRRRTRDDYARLRDVPMHDTHRFMDPVAVSDIPRLIAGWDDALDEKTMTRLNINSDAVRAEVRRRVNAALTLRVVDV